MSARTVTCFVHAGGHKTGTSALQRFLFGQREALAQQGFLVPLAGSSNAQHGPLVRRLAGFPVPERFAQCTDDLRAELAASRLRHVILSSEMIESLLMRAAGFDALFDFLHGLELRVVFVYYVRNQPQLINSQYVQQVRTFRTAMPFREYVRRNALQRKSSLTFLQPVLARRGIGLQVRPYNALLRQRGIVRDFLDCIGLAGWQPSEEGPRINEALGPVAVQAARSAMAALPERAAEMGDVQASACGQALLDVLAQSGLREPGYCGLTERLARRIGAAYVRENAQFARRVWRRPWNEVFAGDVECEHVCNDLSVIDASPEQRAALEGLLARLRPQIEHIATEPSLKDRAGRNSTRYDQMRSFGRPLRHQKGDAS